MQDNDFRPASGSAAKTQKQFSQTAPQFEDLEQRVMLDAAPVINWEIDDYFILGDDGLTIGVDGFDADGDALQITVDKQNGEEFGYVITDVDSANRYAQINFEDSDGNSIGSILVQLFEDRSPLATTRFIDLATKYVDDDQNLLEPTVDDPAFYTDMLVHRLIPEFMLQSGDAELGTGSGGSPLDDYDYEGDDHLSFAGRGVLAAAHLNNLLDTNNSQFFITAAPTPHLNGVHTVFGQVISGWDVYEQIINTPAGTVDGSANRPFNPPVISSIDIVNSDQDGTITIWADDGFNGPTDLTITVTDALGNTAEKVITIYREADLDDTPATETIDNIELAPGEVQPDVANTVSVEIDYSGSEALQCQSWIRYTSDVLIPITTNIVPADGNNFTLEYTLPAEYTGTEITIYVSTKLADFDNASPSSKAFTLSLGTRPEIEELDTVEMDPDTTEVIQLDVTDDTEDFTLDASTLQAGIVVSIDSDTHELTVTTPVDYYGVFVVSVTAIETEFAAFTGIARTSQDIVFAALGERPTISPIDDDEVSIALGTTEPAIPITISIADDHGEDLTVQANHEFGDVEVTLTDDDEDGVYDLTIILNEDDFRGTFEITITAIEDVTYFDDLDLTGDAAEDHLEVASYTITVTTLGARPVIANPDEDIYLTGGQRYTFNPEITDDSNIGIDVELDTNMADTYVWLEEIADINGDIDHWELVVDFRSLPVDYSGLFKVTLSALESDLTDDDDNIAEATLKEFTVVAGAGFDPDIITIVESEEDEATVTEVVGDTLYMGTDGGLEIYDISDPENPVLLDSFETTHDVNDLHVHNGRVYISQEGIAYGSYVFTPSKLHILDVTDPSDIIELATISTIGKTIGGLQISSDASKVYLATYAGGISIYDISSIDGTSEDVISESDLDAPVVITSLDNYDLNGINDLLLEEDGDDFYLYLMENSGRVYITKLLTETVDDEEITSLEQLSFFKTSIYGFDKYDQNGHKLFKIDDAGTPSMAELDTENHVLFVADSNTGIWVYDVSNRERPKKLDWLGWAGTYIDINTDSDIAVISDGGFHRFLDISDPKNVEVLQRIYAPGWVGRATITDDLVVLPYGSEGATIMDMSSLNDLTSSSKSITFTAPDNTEIKFNLAGAGLIRLHSDNDGNLTSVELTGTNKNTRLTIKASSNYELCQLDIYGNLNQLTFKNLTVTSDINIFGFARNIRMEDVGGQTRTEPTLMIMGDPGISKQPTVNISAGDIENLRIDSSVPIGTLRANSWTDNRDDIDDQTTEIDTIVAPSIKAIRIAGDFGPKLQLNSDGDSIGSLVLGSAIIRGTVDDIANDWSIAGVAGKVKDSSGILTGYQQNLGLRDTSIFTSRTFIVDGTKLLKVRITGGGYIRMTVGNGADYDIESLSIITPTSKTNVTITCPQGDLVLGELSSDSTLNKIFVKGVTIDGDVTISGAISRLVLDDIDANDRTEQVIIISGDEDSDKRVNIVLGDVSDLRINSEMEINSLTVDSWIDDETDIDDNTIEVDVIKAPYIGNLLSKGDFMASLDVDTEGEINEDTRLKNVVVRGNVSESIWLINGRVNSATFVGDLSGVLDFTSAGNIIAKSDANNLIMSLGMDIDDTQFAINLFKVVGSLNSSRILAAGNIKDVIVGAADSSDIYAGFVAEDPDEVSALPTEAQLEDADLFEQDGVLKKFVVKGLKNGSVPLDSFKNSSIAAGTIKSSVISRAETDPAEDNFGLAAYQLDSFKYLDADKANNFRQRNLSAAADIAVLDNFIIRIV